MQFKWVAVGVSVVGGVLVVLAGVLGWVVMPNVIDNKIKEETQLKKGSDTWNKWADIPYPIYLIFYVFHVTNPDNVEAGEKPVFLEKGPYAYRQKRTKENITQPESDETVQYVERKTYFFDEDKSCDGCSEDDLVDVINIPFVAVMHEARLPTMANLFMKEERLLRRNIKVSELLFKGMDVSYFLTVLGLGEKLKEKPEFSDGRFGLYKLENGTDSKMYNINTGVKDHKKFGMIKTFNGTKELNFWKPNTTCDIVKGNDGTLHPPFVKQNRDIDVFSIDLCRSLRFVYKEKSEVKGIKAYRFSVDKESLEDPRNNTANECYCTQKNITDCPKAGAISLEGCRGGAPILMTPPYFLDSDKGYLEQNGLPKADEDKHLTYLDIEPHSGVLLRAHKRIQVNIFVDIEGIGAIGPTKAYENFTENLVFPLVWADEYAEMDEKNADDLKSKLIKPLKAVDIAKWTVLGVGAVSFLGGIGLFIYLTKK